LDSKQPKFYTFRVFFYSTSTALAFIILFSPVIYTLGAILYHFSSEITDFYFWLIFFSPLFITVVYLLSWVTFVLVHSKFIVPFFLPKVKPGRYPLSDKATKLLVIRLSADQTARMMLIPLDFMPLVVNRFLRPFFLKRYGAKIGKNSYISRDNKIDASPLISAGDNLVVGQLGLVSCHLIVKGELILNEVKIGNNVTIGGYALVGPGSILEDDVIVGAGAVIPNKHIPKGATFYSQPGKILFAETELEKKEKN
jgi:hypothetical protein